MNDVKVNEEFIKELCEALIAISNIKGGEEAATKLKEAINSIRPTTAMSCSDFVCSGGAALSCTGETN